LRYIRIILIQLEVLIAKLRYLTPVYYSNPKEKSSFATMK
jgi:hypothetical protein